MNTTLLLQMRVFLTGIRLCSAGVLTLALLLTLPARAAELSYSATPLFWATGAQPNVALMLDTSGSMGTKDTGGSGNITSVCDATTITQPMTRMQAAKEAACQVAKDNADSMRIGLYRFLSDGSNGQQVLPVQTNTSASLVTSINTLGANGNTPLSSAMSLILNDFAGAASPIQYRCQKNYIVFFTDGAPTNGIDKSTPLLYPALSTAQSSTWHGGTAAQSGASVGSPGWDGFLDNLYNPDGTDVYPWLDDLAQFGYDVDMKGTTSTTPAAACPSGVAPAVGRDCAGVSWDATGAAKQNVITYTLGMGANARNGLMLNTPLVNQVALAPANIDPATDTISLAGHGLEDGQYIHYYAAHFTSPLSTTATGDAVNNQLTNADTLSMSSGAPLTYSNAGGTALTYISTPATSCSDVGATMGLTIGANYYVANRSATTIRLAATPELAISCAGAANGSGTATSDCTNLTTVGANGTTQSFARSAVTAVTASVSLSSTTGLLVFDGTTNVEKIIINNHGLSTGDRVTYTCVSCGGGQPIGGLTSGNIYTIAAVDLNTIRFALNSTTAAACAGAADNTATVGSRCLNITKPSNATARTHTFARASVTALTVSVVANGDTNTNVPVHDDAGIERITFSANHNLATADKVAYGCSGGAPAVSSSRTNYYATNVAQGSPGTFELSLTPGGPAVDITNAGNPAQTFTWTAKGTIGGLYAYETDDRADTTPDPLNEPGARGKYYVEYVDSDSFKLRQCGTAADCTNEAAAVVDITSTGYGTLSTGPGRSYFASTSLELSNALSTAFKAISASTLSFSSVTTTSAEDTGPSRVYQATFATGDWSGDVVAYGVDANFHIIPTAVWLASEHVPPQPPAMAARNILTWNPTSDQGVAIANRNSLTPNQQISLNPALTVADQQKVLDWVLGTDDVTLVGSRARENGVYGDIIGSSPHYVGQPNQSYDVDLPDTNADGTDSGKLSYLAFKTTTRRPMVYVGSNDGMMHGMDANTGEEKLGFIPNAVYLDYIDSNDNGVNDGETYVQKFYELTRKDYGQIATRPHRFFVDGKITSGDAFFGSAWHTVVVGGLGRGGRSIYALDVTDPENLDATKVLWEHGSAESTGGMGYSYSKPFVARLQNGQWVAIFGNGYDGASDLGRLYVLDLETGDLVADLIAPGSKGLSTVTLLKDNTGSVVTAYAGDLAGNVWKFDLRNNPGTLTAPATPLFQALDSAGNGQPITSAITLGGRPVGSSCSSGFCAMLYFGTGSYFQTMDRTYDPATAVPVDDAFYAVYDDGSTGTVGMNLLQEQTIGTTVVGTTTYRTVNSTTVSYGSKRGWYIRLVVAGVQQGERVVFEPVLAGKVVFFSTVIPTNTDLCASGGSSWIMGVSALDGSMRSVLFDTNGDGLFDSNDAPTAGVQSTSGLFTGLVVRVFEAEVPGPSGQTQTGVFAQIYSGTSGDGNAGPGLFDTTALLEVIPPPPPPGPPGGPGYPKGRMSWRQLQ